jgi:hypothetical protein
MVVDGWAIGLSLLHACTCWVFEGLLKLEEVCERDEHQYCSVVGGIDTISGKKGLWCVISA